MRLSLLLSLCFSLSALADTAFEIELVNAAHNGTPYRLDGDVGGKVIVWQPYNGVKDIGVMEFTDAEGALTLEDGKLAGTLKASLPGKGPSHKRGPEIPFDVTLDAQVQSRVISGKWTSGNRSGKVHGFVREIPKTGEITRGTVTLDRAYPFPGREGGGGYQGLQFRLGGPFTIKEGKVVEGMVGPMCPKASWYPGRAFAPSKWTLPSGQTVVFGAHGYEHKDTSISGLLQSDTLTLQLKSKIDKQPDPVVWDLEMKRYGTLWAGKWKWTIHEGKKDMSLWAAARLTHGKAKAIAKSPEGDSQKAILLRHAIALAEHPGNVIWRDDVLAMTAKGTGNKQYDNCPNNLAGAVYTGLLLNRLSDDPMVKAEGMAMARRAAYWYSLLRYGPLKLAEYYKGMFWVTSWAGFAFAELTEEDPDGPWKKWGAELAESIMKAQLPSGAWTWVEEGSGKKGTANHRNDRSCDNRELNCGDLLLALSMLGKATGVDTKDAEARASAFLAKTMASSPPDWFYQDRRPGDTVEALGTVCYLQWLVQQEKRDKKQIDAVKKVIESKFLPEGKMLIGYMPRWTPGSDTVGSDLSLSARYAGILKQLGENGGDRVETILKAASPESGIVDYLGRDLPADAIELGKADGHAYLCLKVALAWEILKGME